MFGIKKFKKAKTRKFESDKERRQYFAIQAYYKKKNEQAKNTSTVKPSTVKKKSNNTKRTGR